jgi:hypothetical protein
MSGGGGFVFEIDDELSSGDLLALIVTLPGGDTLQVWAEVSLVGRVAVLRQFAIYGMGMGPREVGLRTLRSMARAAMEVFDVDCIRIEEARRTSGANPGRTLRAIEFRR